MADMTAHEILIRAKAYLLNHGWTQGGYGNKRNGPRCMLGAIDEVTGMRFGGPEAHFVLLDFTPSGVPTWNDAPHRTFEEVIDVFDKAILATAPPSMEPPSRAPEVPVCIAASALEEAS